MRAIEPIPIEHEGQRAVLLRDPYNISPNGLSVSLQAYFIISIMNGVNSINDILKNFSDTFKANIPLKDIENLVKTMDENFLLDNENFDKRRKKIVEDFMDAPVRKSALAGKSYSADAAEVAKMLDGYITKTAAVDPPPFALVAPHIDIAVGGPSYGAAYSRLAGSTAETFVILAIGHSLTEDFFACIDKDFETPLGISPTDHEFLAALESDFGEPIYKNAFVHRSEHSAELQVLFLQKLFGGSDPPRKIVPILLSFPETIDELNDPLFNPDRVGRFIKALKKSINAMGGNICIIAGIDLSHVGKRFGQNGGAPKERLEEIEKEDRKLLDIAAGVDKKGLVEFMKVLNPKNHVCGFPALYVLMELLEGCRVSGGKLLDYRQSVEGKNDSVVSFAAMAYFKDI